MPRASTCPYDRANALMVAKSRARGSARTALPFQVMKNGVLMGRSPTPLAALGLSLALGGRKQGVRIREAR